MDTSSRKKTRKRTRNPNEHKKSEKKRKVQNGEEYTTKTGKVIEAKIFRAQNSCVCSRKCPQNINSERQNEIFSCFYGLKNWTQKTLYLRTLCKSACVKKNLNPVINLKKRNFSNKYYLSNQSGVQHQVCLDFILKCVQIPRSRFYAATKSIVSNETAKDNRGKFPTNKTSESDMLFVKEFINSFPTYESHYKIVRTNLKYLSPFLNIKRMYKEYCLKCNFKRRKPLSEWKFRHVFNTEFNLSFARLKVDTCRKCDMLNTLSKSQEQGSAQQIDTDQQKREHLELVNNTKIEFDKTVEFASNPDNKTVVYTFDLQRALETPVLQTSEVYYMRQLWVYNLGIYDEVKKTGYMYVYNESIASRGSQEVASCLFKHFMKFVPSDTQKIILRSDACSGQNRNIKMSLMLKKFLCMWNHVELTSIEQHFYVSGHSYNSCDRSFALIEKQKQTTESIYIPDHWINIIKQAKKTDPKFVVIEMTKNDFYSSEPLEQLVTNRKKTTTGEKINWLNVQKIIYERYSPFMLDFINYGSNSTITISLQKRGTSDDFAMTNLPILFPQSRKIAYPKYKDLQKLLKYIPEKFRNFYRSLEHDQNNSIKDFALADRQSSDENESDDEI